MGMEITELKPKNDKVWTFTLLVGGLRSGGWRYCPTMQDAIYPPKTQIKPGVWIPTVVADDTLKPRIREELKKMMQAPAGPTPRDWGFWKQRVNDLADRSLDKPWPSLEQAQEAGWTEEQYELISVVWELVKRLRGELQGIPEWNGQEEV